MIEQVMQDSTNGAVKEVVSFAELLEAYKFTKPEAGQIIGGTIMKIAHDAVFVDIGAKREAIVPYHELDELDDKVVSAFSQGDEINVYITRTPVGSEELIVSLKRAWQVEDWQRAEAYLEEERLLDLEVIEHNKGGLLVQFGHLQGFVPNSHVPELRRVHDRDSRQSFKSRQIGETLPVKVLEVDRERKRLVLSATAAEKEQRQKQLEALEEGSIVTGRIAHMVDYGAFVDLGAVDGLVHISKISWDHIDHPSDVLSIGDEIEVRIEKVDVERERISLNRKTLLSSPWEQFAEKHEVDELIEGVVTNVVDFGAFVRVDEGIEGLIHISELDMRGASHPSEVLQEGSEALVRIISVEPERERLGLSRQRVTTSEEIEWMSLKSVESLEDSGEEE